HLYSILYAYAYTSTAPSVLLLLTVYCAHRDLHSFPTRRSSDLLDGVHEVLEASEAQRLELMQSFAPAHRKTTDTQDGRGTVIELYDRLLPYAVLFGLQKHWTKVLSQAYQRHLVKAPFWYPGLLDHGAVGFSDALGQMLSSVSSAASTSTPGTGSTGGGFAGGGGGGGAAGGR